MRVIRSRPSVVPKKEYRAIIPPPFEDLAIQRLQICLLENRRNCRFPPGSRDFCRCPAFRPNSASGSRRLQRDSFNKSSPPLSLSTVDTLTDTPDFRPQIAMPTTSIVDPAEVEKALEDFDYFGADELLDNAMEECTLALQSPLVLCDGTRTLKWKILKATGLYLRFERDAQDSDVHEAIQIFELAATSSVHVSPVRVQAFYGLGRCYEALYDQYGAQQGSMNTVSKCYEVYQEASSMARQLPPLHIGHLLEKLTVHYCRSMTILGSTRHDKDKILEARELLSAVLQRIPESKPLRAHALAGLCFSYWYGWWLGDRHHSDGDLSKSAELGREALHLGSGHRRRFRYLAFLAEITINTNTPEARQQGLQLAQDALALLPPSRAHFRGRILNIVGGAYYHEFEAGGRFEELEMAVKYFQFSASLKHTLTCLTNLSICLHRRFQVTGRLTDIDNAIAVALLALGCVPSGHNADYARASLCQAYVSRCAATTTREDFPVARANLETGIQTNVTPALSSIFLRGLASLSRMEFDLSAAPGDLDAAIENGNKAVALVQTMVIDTDTSSIISEHADNHLRRFTLHHSPQDLSDSIRNHRRALDLSSSTHHERHVMLWRYGHALRVRFEAFHEYGDSEHCAGVLQEALERAVAAGRPKQSLYLAETGALFAARYVRNKSGEDLQVSLAYYLKAAQTPEGLASDRFAAALNGGRLAQEYGRLDQATELFSAAVALLPRIAWLGLNASKRHAKLVQTASQLACDAAALAVQVGLLERAIELLDEGRSIVWRSVLDLRTDLHALEEKAPELARELLDVGQELEQDEMGAAEVSEAHVQERAGRRRRAAERWEDLVGAARRLPGFESFLKPLGFAVLRQAASEGPVVLLNVSQYGSAALIVSFSGPVQAISLPGVDFSTVRRMAYILTAMLHVARDGPSCTMLERVLLDTARQLWIGGMDKVAAALKCSPYCTTSDHPFRVWWIPTGFLSLLPIHCAGPHQIGCKGIPDLFISSYSTTLSALLLAREKRSALDQTESRVRMLVIGLPQTPGYPALPSTRAEMELIEEIPAFTASYKVLYGLEATLEAVVNALPKCNWIHACCHGHYAPEEPLESSFILMDGPLTLSQIGHMRLGDAEFAFLSACHSARHSTRVPDESLHLSAALQIAGFRGVLGAAWSIADIDGPLLAARFYHWLTFKTPVPDARNAAGALHLAINDMRKGGVPLYRWAAFLHIGI